jgi:SAM-dependent methyltransferase
MSDTTLDIATVKTRMRDTWMAGDFGEVARYIQPHADDFVARRRIEPGMQVLDVACGTGNIAVPAARAGATVTGIDIASNLVEQARERAREDGLDITFEEGDAEALAFADASFDLVATMYGAMFAPRPERAAAELVRVCRPGGTIAMANWTPDAFIGQMFRVVGKHAPPPEGVPAPILWGDEATVRERLRDGIADLQTQTVSVIFEYPFPVPDVVDFHFRYFGPTERAHARLDEAGRAALRRDLEAHWDAHNQATDGTTRVEAQYLEVIATRA